jgi:predicted phosphoribosyltransferase
MFHDREDAGRQLAAVLRDRPWNKLLVVAIPCGGAITGAALARELGAEFDVVLSAKLQAPDQREQAIGAITENGTLYLNDANDEGASIPDEYIHREKEHQSSILATRRQAIRKVKPRALVAGRSVVVTDDGVATGSTMIAALQAIRSHEPRELIVAVPVAPADKIRLLEQYCDRVVCLLPATRFLSVGQFYEAFPSVDQSQVIHVLKKLQSLHD